MKVLVNNKFGGFRIKDEVIKKVMGEDACFASDDVLRVNAELIAMKERGEDIEDNVSDLIVVEVPKGATDWKVFDYDGMESLYAVVDGKIIYCG